MIIKRVWAMPSAWTFTIKPISELLQRYVGNGKNWIDPFCGKSELAEFRNDLDEKIPNCEHKLALDFVNDIKGSFNGILFDPPYSGRQVGELYTHLNKKTHRDDTNAYFYSSVKNAIAPKIKVGGYAISFGWNSNGFGKNRGFEIKEILLVAHGGHHNDTIVTVEVKNQGVLF